ASLVVGRYNDTLVGSQTSMTDTTPLFTVGNGTANNNRKNALVVQNNGNLTISGEAYKPGGSSWTATSDARLKSGVVDYKEGLAALLKIHPVKFHYNEKSGFDTQKEYIGVIAQELKEVAPYMVGTYTKDGEEYLNVDNSAMTYMLINSVKALKAENDDLK